MVGDLSSSPDVADLSSTNLKIVFLAGGIAGTSVDVLFFPLDTIKTRLQSEAGFRSSGGFKGLYSGLLSVFLGSAPSAALFFLAYETTKKVLGSSVCESPVYRTASHMAAASVADVTACLVRVPVEIVKQRTQALRASSSYATFLATYRREGLRGFYRGYVSTVARELPFSMLQFPLWEFLKLKCSENSGRPPTPGQSSLCAAVAGGISAAVTTPLDVVKTRIMLSETGTEAAKGNIACVIRSLIKDKGVSSLFTGLFPRVWLLALGGAVFLGAYDKA